MKEYLEKNGFMAFHSLLSVILCNNNVLFHFALECTQFVHQILYAYSYKISYKQKINVSYARNISVNVQIAFMGIKKKKEEEETLLLLLLLTVLLWIIIWIAFNTRIRSTMRFFFLRILKRNYYIKSKWNVIVIIYFILTKFD